MLAEDLPLLTMDVSFDVDNKVKIEYLGKLGESLFDESCDRLATAITRFLIKESPIVVHYLRAYVLI